MTLSKQPKPLSVSNIRTDHIIMFVCVNPIPFYVLCQFERGETRNKHETIFKFVRFVKEKNTFFFNQTSFIILTKYTMFFILQ